MARGYFSLFETRLLERPAGKNLLEDTGGENFYLYAPLEDATSLLQSIGETLTMLGFSYRVSFSGHSRRGSGSSFLQEGLQQLQWTYEADVEWACDARDLSQLHFLVADPIERFWPVVALYAGKFLICRIPIERNLALLLEHSLCRM
jgi:hypothetical protein